MDNEDKSQEQTNMEMIAIAVKGAQSLYEATRGMTGTAESHDQMLQSYRDIESVLQEFVKANGRTGKFSKDDELVLVEEKSKAI